MAEVLPEPVSDLDRELAGIDALDLGEATRQRLAARIWSLTWPKLAAAALAIGLWQLVVVSGWKPQYTLPSPFTVFDSLGHEIGRGRVWEAVATTMRRALIGYAISVVVGTAIGLVVSRVRILRVAVGSMITGLQTMPSVVWLPLAVILFQLSESAIFFVVLMGSIPSIANGLISGVDHVPPIYLRAGRVLGAKGIAIYRHVVVPAALPAFVGGLKQGWAFAWRSLMAGELIQQFGKLSIGGAIQISRDLSDVPLLMGYMVVVLVIGIVMDSLFTKADISLRRRWGLLT
jgi:NitT/TauT family transport system permease protein